MNSKGKSIANNQEAKKNKKNSIGNQSVLKNKIKYRIILGLATLLFAASVIFVSGLAQDGKPVSPTKTKSEVSGQSPETFSAKVGNEEEKPDEVVITTTDGTTLSPVINNEGANPVSVTATAGTPGPTNYATLKDAFDAINAGTHQGIITVDIVGNSTETATAALNASGSGAASYTSVSIQPVGGSRTITGSIVGAIIKLVGADNVTIDGRISGTGRNLTVSNTSTAASTAAIWLTSTGVGAGATNNTIRNLEISCGATQNTSTNSTFGIIMASNNTAISTSSNSDDNDNNSFIANRIIRARYGIVTRGTTTNLALNTVVSDNIIGPTSFGADEIGKVGIFMQADQGATVTRNTVQFVGGDFANTTGGADRVGIGIGQESWSAAPSTLTSNTYTVTKNIIRDVVDERTFSAVGLLLGTTGGGSATNNLVANNFIFNVKSNGTSGDQTVGLGISGGHTDRVVFNSISLTGDVDPNVSAAATTNYGSGIRIGNASGSTHANLTLQNNSVYLDLSSSSTAGVRYYAISGNAAGYSFGTGGENYNNYYINPSNTQLQTGGLGTSSGNTLTTQFASLANWQTAYTTPQDANSIQADPQYVSTTSDLHIAMASPNVNAGVAIAGIMDDIDGQLRVAAPDIGADEPNGITPPVNDIAASSFVSPMSGATIPATVAFAPQASFTGIGTATQTNVPVRYRILNGMMAEVCNVTTTIPSISNGQTITATFPNCTVPSAGTHSIIATAELAGDSNSANDMINGTITAALPLSGTYTVPGDYSSLTNAGGIFEALNSVGATGNVVINITADLTGENGTVALNELSGGFTVLIKPSGAPRMITGSSTNSIIRLNGADGVTIDGAVTMAPLTEAVGGNPALRQLTVINTNPAATAGAVIAVMSGTNGAQNNTIKNVNIIGQDPTQTLIGLHLGGNAVGSAGTDNDNNRVENCSIQKAFIGLYNTGASAANQNTGNVVTMNDLSATGANRLRRAGMLFFNHDGLEVSMNSIGGITSDEGLDAYGIGAGIQAYDTTTTASGAITNSVITKNRINGIASTSTTGFSAVGIGISGGTTGPNTISNNMISGVIAPSTNPDLVAGIYVTGVASSSTRLYHNSVSLTGDRGSVASQIGSYGVAITGTNPVVELKNNIFHNALTSGGGANAKSYSIGMVTTTFTNLNSNYNDFFASGANVGGWRRGGLGATATDDTTLAAWQTATSQDANSFDVDPLFVSTTDLHLQMTSTMINAGTTGTGVTDDIDDQTRDAMPDVGADELVVMPGTLQFSSATYSIGEAGNMVTLTVTRTGGSDGAVNVDYSLGGGTATGGAACGGAVDYVNMGGTLMFANGETMKTFDVTICEDAVFEGNETFDAMLSNATGGATIGTPGTATVTITDNDVAIPGTLQFSSATYMVGEAGTMATITVTRTGGSDGAVSADYATVAGGSATGGASCGGSVDYATTMGTVMFGNGVTTPQTFNIPICNDADVEGNETVNLALTNPTGGATLGMPNTAVLTINDDDMPPAGNVIVNPGNVAYMTLKDAFDAINAGTHTGAITVDIFVSTTETASAVLNSSGAGSASYTSVMIRPATDAVTVSGPSLQGRGLIELNGADNVTIDGDNPNTSGINRNLTLQNTAASTTTFTSVVRIALATSVVNSADNNTIKNLNILGSATGRNISTATSTTASENTTFGIFAGPGGSTASATNPPAAVTSVLTSVGTGATASNLVISNNAVTTVGRGISANGSATTVFPGLLISDNRIGNQTAADLDQVYSIGITAQGSANGLIMDNTVWIEGYIGSSAATHGINVGVNSANGTFTIERNKVNRVRNNNGQTWSAFGINLGGGSNHIVQNNFISGVINNQTAGTGAFGTTFGAYGIRISSGTGHKIYHNSVHLYDALLGTTSTNLTAAFLISSNTLTGIDVRNNVFSNQVAGGNPASPGTRNVAIYLPSAATSAFNLTLNNNGYFNGLDALNRMAQVGATFGTGEFLAANFDPTQTTPSTNFRSYSSTLNAAGTNDNASFASTTAPPFTSNVDLHIPANTVTRLESGGAAVGVVGDIDLDTRNATTPDIGADEFMGLPPFPNDMAAAAFITPVNGATLPVGQNFSPQASFNNNGTVSQSNVTVRYRILDAMNVVIYNETGNISTISPLQTVTVTFPATSLPSGGTYTIRASAELAGDQDISNDTINGMVTAVPPLNGMINVGVGETYTSLTNAGGVFQALNTSGISSDLTVNITSDLTGETGAVVLNQITEVGAGGYTVTFKPSGAARSITGTSAASMGLIVLHGADRIVFDGSLSGGNDRSLTITNNQATSGIVIWMRSPNASNGANNNTIKNCIINGAPGPNSTTVGGILAGSSVTLGGDAEAPNSNNTIHNNWIYRVQNSLFIRGGTTAPNFDQNWVITNNELGSNVTNDNNIFRGMLIGNSQNFMIANNLVHGIRSTTTTTAAMSGIQLALLLNTGTVKNNVITNIKNVSNSGTGAFGMQISSSSTASNVTIANNFISDVTSNGLATVNSNGFGMMFNGSGTGYNVYFNSINMNTNQSTGTISAAMNVNTTFATPGALNVRNNIFSNTQTTGTRYAVYSTAAAGVFTAIDYNDYFAQNVGFIGGSARVTLGDWQTATGQDANSKAVDPLFVSPTDLHLQPISPLFNMGTPIVGITDDIDGQTRDMMPDIGADELVNGAGILAFSSSTYTVGESTPMVTITVNRTGTMGAVSVNYGLTDGTATGGAACGGNVDYINTGGTVMFADGQASKTFDVALCPDSLNKINETFTVTLSSPTGGAILGSPNMAVVTITDDDPQPSISISDVTLAEGNSGTTTFTFNVNLSAPSGQTVTVNYQTADGTATVANNDYVAISNTVLTFNPGQTSLPVNVSVNGDTNVEPNETFFVNLSNATNATISDNQGVGTIINDDFPPGTLTINDVRITEGNSGTSTATFTVTLMGGPPVVTVNYQTANGTATAGSDYQAASGTLTFGMPTSTEGGLPTQTRTFNVTINGDNLNEANETFFVNLSSPSGATIADGQGVGFIVDDDRAYNSDFDNDRKSDISVFRPSNGTWYTLQSTNGIPTIVQFGTNGDRPVPGDYDGDGITDRAVWRPSDGVWYILQSSDSTFKFIQWGLNGDKPVQGDYNGDGLTDLAVFRPSEGVWYILQIPGGPASGYQFGLASDVPVQGDYDGDAKTDIAVFRNGTWYILRSSDNSVSILSWGISSDKVVSGDFDGDGKVDLTIYRDGVWWILESLTGNAKTISWGLTGDVPVAGDFDGDGTSDIAVFRPSDGNWYILRSSDNTFTSSNWGVNNDIPVPSAYLPQ